MSKPELSIIMPLFNSERYVGVAVESLLSQSYGDFELIIVNDCSTDGSLEVLRKYNDQRICIMHNETNQGIVFSRNKGLKAANGTFIAPFDSDDVAMPNKFNLQIGFLKKHTRLGMLGSWAKLIDENGNLLKKRWKLKAKSERIPAVMFFRNYFVQSAVIMRRDAMPKHGYRNGYDLVEDWMMWCEIAENHPVWNFPEYLIQYRIHKHGNSQADSDLMHMKDKIIFGYHFNKLGLKPDNHTFELFKLIKNQQPITNYDQLKQIEAILIEIAEANIKTGFYDHKQMMKVLLNRWMKICSKTQTKQYRLSFDLMSSRLFTLYFKRK
jgi:glycosyltransferase involved in cell wall biosynthesis